MRSTIRLNLLVFSILFLASCGKVIVREGPSFAHIHIGHAITGFRKTPKNQGLLVMADIKSVVAATNNELLVDAVDNGDVGEAKGYIQEIANVVAPDVFAGDSEAYGLDRAVAETITHLELAADDPSASLNVQRTATRANIKAMRIVRNIENLAAFLDAGLKSNDIQQLRVITKEIDSQVKEITGGNGAESEYGLFEYRQDIEDMIAREDPPYQTVDSFFLFNLIELPTGEWGFNSRRRGGTSYQ